MASRLGITANEMIDFSANINPLGLSKHLLEILQQSLNQIVYYPNPEYPDLKRAIATHFNVSSHDVMVGNGAVQMIFDTANAVQAKKALVLAPTFGEYERSFTRSGMAVDHYYLKAENRFQLDADDLISYLEAQVDIDLICLCNPNNPTGSIIQPTDMQRIANYCVDKHKWLIIDEAFMDFVDHDKWSFVNHLTEQLPVIILRSATKFFAIPGLRLGFAVTKNQRLQQALQTQAEPWSVNTLADHFGQHMYEDHEYIDATYQWLNSEKPWLFDELQQLPNLQVFDSFANYYLIKSDIPNLREKLWHQRMMIRSCVDYYGLNDHYYRVAVRSHSENEQLVAALRAVVVNPVS
ncbi:threonine-phosphate decarboxylase CobD [Lentilactobacillus kisonensis]|uniref:threonine-phosphate decarboxylase CobD n=1 Tax=Lentilactobacillus kisonensis TaxID=481722 RepID=UPI002436E0B5|nr:threonine-phosphate decarboxylase CobD [Lentilactobacillus kisonensis]